MTDSRHTPLWDLNISELAGHNIESQGREDVNRLLKEGWVPLHIYTLHYHDDGIWRERPMAVLGRSQPSLRPLRERGAMRAGQVLLVAPYDVIACAT